MPQLSIDGRDVTVPNGTTVIRPRKLGSSCAALLLPPRTLDRGQLPRCLVDVEKLPSSDRLQYASERKGWLCTRMRG
jgi:hypothetical protein